MPFRSSAALLPLTPLDFEILLSLSDGDRHGYAILQAVGERLGGLMPLRTGTLYRGLARLLDEGLIDEVASRLSAADDDKRRRYYRITPHGRQIARSEAARLADQVKAARKRKLLPATRR
jgi:DNA-binding PadR family transcriptional regulator